MAKIKNASVKVLPHIRRPQDAEKWYDAVVVAGTRNERLARALIGTEHRPMEPLRHRIVPQTPHQTKLIIKVIEILNDFRGTLGLKPVIISPDRVRLLPPKVFRRAAGHALTQGFTKHGWIYLDAARCRRTAVLLKLLTHELCHLTAFSVLVVWPLAHLQARYMEFVGLNAFGHSSKDFRSEYLALDEAVTELMANELRHQLISQKIIHGRTADYLRNAWRHTYVTLLVVFLANDLGKTNEEAADAVRTMSIDYFKGTSKFIAILRRRGLLSQLQRLNTEKWAVLDFILNHERRRTS